MLDGNVLSFSRGITQGTFYFFQVVITYVAYLCARLLDLREETKAARCIQMAWRRHRLKRQLERKKVCKMENLWLKNHFDCLWTNVSQ